MAVIATTEVLEASAASPEKRVTDGNKAIRDNCFNVIRLLAALQVVYIHTVGHLQIEVPEWIDRTLRVVPGVPVFFFISGFLISRSYESNPVAWEYAKNRALRIYPALWVCFLVSVVTVLATGYLSWVDIASAKFWTWVVAQNTVGQFYNPGFMRGYGVGVLNGSLWTICVELQFYVLILMIYAIERVFPKVFDKILFALGMIFLLANIYYVSLDKDATATKLLGVSFIPWFYMFVVGIGFQRNFERLRSLLPNLLPWLALSLVAVIVLGELTTSMVVRGNDVPPLIYLLTVMSIFAFAYRHPSFGGVFFRKNDWSYGVYIYHMVWVNLFVFLGMRDSGNPLAALTSVLFLSLVCGMLSWTLIEKAALSWKRHALNPVRH